MNATLNWLRFTLSGKDMFRSHHQIKQLCKTISTSELKTMESVDLSLNCASILKKFGQLKG